MDEFVYSDIRFRGTINYFFTGTPIITNTTQNNINDINRTQRSQFVFCFFI